MKSKLIICNWKMNPKTLREAVTIAKAYKKFKIPKNFEIACAVPVSYLADVKKIIGGSKIKLAIQNFYSGDIGAHTGEISLPMLSSYKISYAIVGHSERRNPPAGGGETDEFISAKVQSALKAKVTPILCVGESTRDDSGQFLRVVEEQLKKGLQGIPKTALDKVVIAYEPVWAIGAGAPRAATSDECREMIIFIKKVLSDISGGKMKSMPRVIYGASVDETDAQGFIDAGADGLLPGRLSLNPKNMQKMLLSLDVK